MNRRKWLKRGVVALVLLALVGGSIWTISWVLLRRTPDWYAPDTSTASEKHDAAQVIERLIARVYNWGGKQHAAEVNARLAGHSVATTDASVSQAREILAQKPDEAFKISFTDAQLNAFFNKWADTRSRREWFEQYVDDPRLVLRENQLIIAGKARDLDAVVSLVFEPKLDQQGRLNLNLTHVLGGMLPLPDAMWAGQRQAIEHTLGQKLPLYQQTAAISPEGIANGDAASAAMNQLLTATLHYRPSQAVIFVPIELAHLSQSLPVKITAFSIHDHTLDMTVEQMTPDEREAVLKRLLGEDELAAPDHN